MHTIHFYSLIPDDHPYECSDCGKCFKYTWLRDKHIKWKHCPINFKKANAENDSWKEKGGKVHKCTICQKSYPYLSAYLLHLKSHRGKQKLYFDILFINLLTIHATYRHVY